MPPGINEDLRKKTQTEITFMTRSEWYRAAFKNLGFAALVQRQIQRAAGCDKLHCLSSKYLQHRVYARPKTSDYATFDQIFVENQYRCFGNMSIPRDGLIIDCGANVGYSAAYFLSRWPTCRLIAIEPEPDNFAMLKRNLAPYKDRCTLIRGAVWPHPGKVTLLPAAPGNEWGHRVTHVAPNDPAPVPAINLNDVIGTDTIHLLKIDIEGAETELFRVNPKWLARTLNLVIELHDDEAARIFHGAIAPYRFRLSNSGELTVCLASTH